ncbi:MAG: hypothetical protein KatS3mg108_1405 [Isosphaeraceae bacterium]|jgi:osmoprotectant transport system ATP-binding protein|nr:MAG: hypothetical protein KatS3mg108_1405 [Isosphaeraceae bacterium]
MIAVGWRQVTKRYADGHLALEGVTLEVEPGRGLAILGTSGSGKTTLLRMVNRLIEPTSGTVEVWGRAVSDWDLIRLRRSIGYVIQEVGLMPHLDARANVALGLRALGWSKSARRNRSEELLAMVGLDPERVGRLRPHELSGGQRQRVGVARALASRPELILMDEPFGALDPITRRELQGEFDALRRRLGTTLVMVTHDVREAFVLADRIAVVERGRVVQQGTPEELLAAPETPFVAAFLADAYAVSRDQR